MLMHRLKCFEFVIDEGEPIRSTVRLHPKTLNVSFERCYFRSRYNRPRCGKCQTTEHLPRPFWFSFAECCTMQNLGLKLTDQQPHLSISPPGSEYTTRNTLAVLVNLSKRTDIVVFPVPGAQDVSRGTTNAIFLWNRRWVPLKCPQLSNQMVWPEQRIAPRRNSFPPWEEDKQLAWDVTCVDLHQQNREQVCCPPRPSIGGCRGIENGYVRLFDWQRIRLPTLSICNSGRRWTFHVYVLEKPL